MNFPLPAISLRHKIVLAILLTTIAALVASTLAMYVYERSNFRRSIETDIRTQAQLVADFIAPALTSGDKFFARQTLETLKIRPRIEYACLYTTSGKLFAEYGRNDHLEPLPPIGEEQVRFGRQHASLFLPVKLHNKIIGAIFLQEDLRSQMERWRNRLFIVFAVGFIVVAISILLSLQFQKIMTASLLALTNAARAVVARNDYTVRAPILSRDEIAEVAGAFNQMLDHIAQRASELSTSEGRFRQMADTIREVFWLTDPSKQQILFISRGYEEIWGRPCDELYTSPEIWIDAIHPEDRDRIRQAAHTKQATGQYDEQYRIIRPDGAIRWIHDRAFPIESADGQVYRISGCAADITERRELEEEILRINEREHARIGQDIHDGLCQQLVGITFIAKLLQEKLKHICPEESATAGETIKLLRDAIHEARGIAYALYPANIAEEGLCGAIKRLSDQISETTDVRCHLDFQDQITLENKSISLQLYRISQESINNAIKHANPRNITIGLTHTDGQLELTVEDDGTGISEEGTGKKEEETSKAEEGMPAVAKRTSGGMGLRIMHYRANMIGGTLSIRRRSEGGTIVSCRCPVEH